MKPKESMTKRLRRIEAAGNQKEGVASLVFADLLTVQTSFVQECVAFDDPMLRMTEMEKNKRLLFLFQRDLLPGICGQILESKDHRDNVDMPGVSMSVKRVAWAFLFVLNSSMLFYIFLFAVSQDTHRQSAWATSFAMWLVAEVFLVSTCMVLFTHVAVPAFIMKDVRQIKEKLVDSVVKYHQLISDKENGQAAEPVADSNQFNAAEFLFVSYRVAKAFSKLKTAQVIAQYQTVWPRQSYQHVVDVSKTYDRKFTALTRSASVVLLFFITNLLSVPITIQDMVIQIVTTAVTGYTFLIHLQLFAIFPVLVIIPTIFLGILVHFVFQSRKNQRELDLQMLLKKPAKQHHHHHKKEVVLRGAGAEDDNENSSSDSSLSSQSSISSSDYESESSVDEEIHMPRSRLLYKAENDLSSSDSSGWESASDDDKASPIVVRAGIPGKAYQVRSKQPSARYTGRRQSIQHGFDLLAFAQQQLAAIQADHAEQAEHSQSSEGSASEVEHIRLEERPDESTDMKDHSDGDFFVVHQACDDVEIDFTHVPGSPSANSSSSATGTDELFNFSSSDSDSSADSSTGEQDNAVMMFDNGVDVTHLVGQF